MIRGDAVSMISTHYTARLFGGDDTIFGGGGNDRLIGGQGADTFAFKVVVGRDGEPAIGSGKDVIEDFGPKDRLDLTSWGLDSGVLDSNRDGRIGSGDRNVTIADGNLVIDLGARTGFSSAGTDTVTLEGVGSVSLDQIVPRPADLAG